MAKDSLKDLQTKVIAFRDVRDWRQFHNPKDVALSLVLEATEVMEHFQWKSSAEIEVHIKKNRGAIGDELADVLYWVLLMASDLNIDLATVLDQKMKKNEKKYPVKKSKGRHTKYTEL
jgi:NTP pyrophosphatase (non-canonical NTP hydrolase)